MQAHILFGIYNKLQKWSATPLACWDGGQSLAILNDMCAHTLLPHVLWIVVVTPKGVLLLAMCDASATREGLCTVVLWSEGGILGPKVEINGYKVKISGYKVEINDYKVILRGLSLFHQYL